MYIFLTSGRCAANQQSAPVIVLVQRGFWRGLKQWKYGSWQLSPMLDDENDFNSITKRVTESCVSWTLRLRVRQGVWQQI